MKKIIADESHSNTKKYYSPIEVVGYKGCHTSVIPVADMARIIEDLGHNKLTNVAISDDRRVMKTRISTEEFYVKQYRVKGFKQFLQMLFIRHKAQKSWKFGISLRQQFIPTPEPVSFLHKKKWPFIKEFILITQGVANATTLRNYVQKNIYENRVNSKCKKKLLDLFADFLGVLHRTGIYHGDFSSDNILLEVDEQDNYPQKIYMIDLDAIRSTRRISLRRRIKNIDEIGRNFQDLKKITLLERGRWLKQYMGVAGYKKPDFSSMLHRICHRTMGRLDKNRKKLEFFQNRK